LFVFGGKKKIATTVLMEREMRRADEQTLHECIWLLCTAFLLLYGVIASFIGMMDCFNDSATTSTHWCFMPDPGVQLIVTGTFSLAFGIFSLGHYMWTVPHRFK
jgi:hypothetical protein